MLEFRLLGPLEIRDGDHVLDVRRRKQRALLAALALRVGDPVSSDRLVDDLWGEQAPKTARHALENYVSELRKLLGKHVIATRASGYLLDVDRDQVDVNRFERLVEEARREDPAGRAEKLQAALALVRGEPLADLTFEPFAQSVLPRLQELELGAREELVDAELELGRHAEVVPLLEPLAAAHPYRERLRAQLMLALYRSGRQAEALAAYQEARRMLVEELGIDPGEDLQELERAILRQDPSLRAPAGAPAAEPGAASVAPAPTRRATRKTVSVVVAEIANVTALAAALDPELLRAVLDRHDAVVRAAVEHHGGRCGRLLGARIVSVFGIPATNEDDALRAVRASFDLREGVGLLNDGLLPQHGVFLEVRTAVTTGEVLVAADEAELATGGAVVEADELQRGARPGQILLDAATHALVRDVVAAEELEPAEFGRAQHAYRLVELLPDVHGRALRLDSPLVGRRRQLAALSGAFEDAVAAPALHLFTVLGPAGVGKSRLVREFLDRVDDVATVLHGRCLPYGEAITYWPLVEALGNAGLSETEVDLATATVTRAVLERVSADHPLVVVLDDLHWAEPALLDLVEDVAGSSRGSPILILCVARAELLDSRPTWGGGLPNASSVLLEPLSEAESERLVDNLLGESDLPDSVRDYIVRTAEGNPLFLEELLATLVDRELLRREGGRWTTTEIPAIRLPAKIQVLIAARIDRLPSEEREVLELASIAGRRTFESAMVAELAQEPLRDEIDSHLAGLVRKELIRPTPAAEGQFSFRHQLIRDAAYESLPMRVRAELHGRLAELLERTGPRATVDELVSYHRNQADRYRGNLGALDRNADAV